MFPDMTPDEAARLLRRLAEGDGEAEFLFLTGPTALKLIHYARLAGEDRAARIPCPSDAQIEAFASGTTTWEAAVSIAYHLAHSSCRCALMITRIRTLEATAEIQIKAMAEEVVRNVNELLDERELPWWRRWPAKARRLLRRWMP